MKRLVLLIGTALLATSGAVDAAPGDPRLVTGTLQWPRSLADERFIVVRSVEGMNVYVDVGSAQRRTSTTFAAGDAMTITGVEGERPYELRATVITRSADRSAAAADAGAASPSSGAASPPSSGVASPPSTPTAASERLKGRVESLTGSNLLLRVDDRPITVDVARVDLPRLQPGAEVTVFGVHDAEGHFVASGLVEVSAPSTPPGSGR